MYKYIILYWLVFFIADNNATKKNVAQKKFQYQQLDKIYVATKYLTANKQKNLSRILNINEKDIRLTFRKKRAEGN